MSNVLQDSYKWYQHPNHSASGNVSNKRHTSECTRRVHFIAIDDVLIPANEDTQDSIAGENTGTNGGPR